MDIIKDFKNDIAIVSVNGKMDAVNAGQYQEAVEVLLNDGATKFAVDLSGLQYISSAGLEAFLWGQTYCEQVWYTSVLRSFRYGEGSV